MSGGALQELPWDLGVHRGVSRESSGKTFSARAGPLSLVPGPPVPWPCRCCSRNVTRCPFNSRDHCDSLLQASLSSGGDPYGGFGPGRGLLAFLGTHQRCLVGVSPRGSFGTHFRATSFCRDIKWNLVIFP